MTTFCLMNQEESICHLYRNKITCFETKIPKKFNSAQKTKDYCSFIFPPGYSIYVEEYVLENDSPNNFVLLDGKHLQYSSKLNWKNRRNIFWDMLKKDHRLKAKSNRRDNIQCIKSLKVSNIQSFSDNIINFLILI